MKKNYNKSEIMKTAWALVKTCGIDMSTALKSAWAQAKAIMEAEAYAAGCDWNNKVVANDWVKGGKNRTYVSVRVYTNAWNLKREVRFGYIDNLAGIRVA